VSEATSAVFVSHASEDAVAARRLCELLRAAGIDVWLDQSELRGGDAWDTMIRSRIRGCALFLPLISAHTRARWEGYFRLEWKLAIDRSYYISSDRPFLLPISIDETRDGDARVPDRFREVQWTYAPHGEAPQEFVARMRRMLGAAEGFAGSAVAAGAGALSDDLSEKSLAVMPFANLSPDRENEYFSDGLTEEILNALGGIADLRIAARSSSFYFKGRPTDLHEIANRLRVAHIVEGSVRRVANRVRVTAQLVDVHNGFQLWSERYDREMADLFEIQDDIARAIAGRLKLALCTGARRPTSNMEAYELYLQGRHHLIQRSPTSLHAAIQYFERCISLDPEYALAYAGVADCYGVLPFRGSLPHAAAKARAQTAMKKAIALAPELWECNYSRALYLMYFEGDWSQADQYFKRALEINPRAPLVNAHYAALNSTVRREAEALHCVEAACRLDPLAAQVHAMGSLAMVNLGKFAQGEQLARHALELQPDHLFGLFRHALALSGLARHDEAVATMERVVSLQRTPIFTGVLGLVYARAGRYEDTRRLRQELEDRAAQGECSIAIAQLSLELGSDDRDRVRAALTAAVAEGAQGYHIKIACGPFIEPYRNDPEVDQLHRGLYGW
jgi:TolB-like protein/Tfp pilus assembly protein PilF